MTPREVDLDELFDRNADTRLLERRRREELGLAPPVSPPSAMPARFGPESMLGDGVPLATPRGAMLRLVVDARPNHGLIPGAVVTVVVEIADDGDTDADDVTVRVSVPPGADPIAGSFTRDDVAVDGDALLAEGLRIGTIPAASFVRLRFTIRVQPGTEALDVSAHAASPGVPAVSGPALRLTRREGHAAFDAPRPFFELEAGESADDDAAAAAEPVHAVDVVVGEPALPEPEVARAAAALEPDTAEWPVLAAPPSFKLPAHLIAPQPAPEPPRAAPEPEPAAREPEPPQKPVPEPEPAAAEAEDELEAAPEAELEPSPPQPERGPEPELAGEPQAAEHLAAAASHEGEAEAAEVAPEPEPAAEPLAPPEPAVLARVLDADEVRALERVFIGAVPHGLAALALLSSIAAADGPLGRALGVSAFARSVAAALPRALVAARMNRPTPPVVTAETLALIAPGATAAHEEIPYEGALLVARFDARDLEALRNLLARNLPDPFLRGAQVLLAVAPRAVDGAPYEATAVVRDALAAYRVAAGAWLMRVTVRRAVDRGYDPLTADDPTLHEAGRALVAALREAVR